MIVLLTFGRDRRGFYWMFTPTDEAARDMAAMVYRATTNKTELTREGDTYRARNSAAKDFGDNLRGLGVKFAEQLTQSQE